jgi:hypothetical protein
VALAKETGTKGREQFQSSVENLERRLDMLDRRLDDIDSMISAVIERVMNQPVNIGITCPNCGKSVDVTLIGNKKPRP